jgi:hypothetical protein
MTTTAEKAEKMQRCTCGQIAVSHPMVCLYDTVTGALHHFDGKRCVKDAD